MSKLKNKLFLIPVLLVLCIILIIETVISSSCANTFFQAINGIIDFEGCAFTSDLLIGQGIQTDKIVGGKFLIYSTLYIILFYFLYLVLKKVFKF